MSNSKSYYTLLVGLLMGTVVASAAGKFTETVKGVKMRHMGPGNGGSMFGSAVKPDNPNIIIFGGDMGASYRTVNGGKSWNIIGGGPQQQPRTAFRIKFHPKNSDLVWLVGGGGGYKSLDSGKTWQMMNLPISTCGALGLDSDDPNVVYVAEGMTPRFSLNWVKGRVCKTVDGGKTWQELPRPSGDLSKDKVKQRNYTSIIVDPNSKVIRGQGHATVYLAGRGGFYRSDNAGKSWKDLSGSFAPGQVNDLCLANKAGKSILFITVAPALGLDKGGVYKSIDKGESWQPVNKGLDGIVTRLKRSNRNLAKDRHAQLRTLLLANSRQNPNRLYVGSWQGVARSDDMGKTWHDILPREGGYVKDNNGVYVAVRRTDKYFKRTIWGGIDNFNGFVADQGNADIVFFTDNEGLYRSVNGGKTWEDITFDYGEEFSPKALSETGLPPNRYTHKTKSRGVQNIVCDQVAVDPFDANTYYAAYMDLGPEISRDGGEYWEHPTTGLPSRGHAWAIAVDPAKKGRLLLTIGQRWKKEGGIYRSDDSGKSWQRIGLKDASMGAINDIVIDLKSSVDSRTIYISTEKKGIYQSTDGGKSWKNIFSKQSKDAQNAWTVKIAADGKVYAGTKAGLLVSQDKGKSWKLLKQKLFGRVKVVAVSKSNPDCIYVTANLPKNNFFWGKCRFFRSTDAGKTWQDITPKYIVYAGAIAVNPYDQNYIYACTNLADEGKGQKLVIIRSKDGGKSWQDIGNGIGFNRGVNITIDDNNPQHLFVHARFGLIEIIDSQAPKK